VRGGDEICINGMMETDASQVHFLAHHSKRSSGFGLDSQRGQMFGCVRAMSLSWPDRLMCSKLLMNATPAEQRRLLQVFHNAPDGYRKVRERVQRMT